MRFGEEGLVMVLVLKKIYFFVTLAAELFWLKVFCSAKLHICYEHSGYWNNIADS